MSRVAVDNPTAARGWRGPLICLVVLLAALAGVMVINGGPLYYYDSYGYLDQGIKALRLLGLIPPPEAVAGLGGEPAPNPTVNGSRSVLYSVLAAGTTFLFGPDALPILHMAMVALAIWLVVRVVVRNCLPGLSGLRLAAISLGAAALGSFGFTVAYFMPDIFAGLMLIVLGLLVSFGRVMRWWEIVLAIALAGVAVLAHPSHLVIAAVLVPVALVCALVLRMRRWWLPPALVATVALVGASEKFAFSLVAHEALDADVVYHPFLTARLIQDEVGYDYLAEHCPDPERPTCLLYAKLQESDDPYRLTASHIVFEFSPELGSFRLLGEDVQQRVADDQLRFALAVFLDRPAATLYTVLRNTFRQVWMNSVSMMVPEPEVQVAVDRVPYFPYGTFQLGRLRVDQPWLPWVDSVHKGLYAASLVLLLALVLGPSRLPLRIRLFVVFLVLGVAANAFVCGAVSQPADRYGARVAWLLPFAAAFAGVAWAWLRRTRAEEAGP